MRRKAVLLFWFGALVITICIFNSMNSSHRPLHSYNYLSFLRELFDRNKDLYLEKISRKKKQCSNVLERIVKGKWVMKKGLTKEDLEYRKKIDISIRLKMGWPASLFRNDSRCGTQFLVPGYWLKGQCDPDSEKPCCNHMTGWCGNSSNHCSCSNCTDLSEMQPAEVMDWVPDDENCNMDIFTTEATCALMNKHISHISFIGDSLIRQMYTTMILLLTGNSNSGAIPVNASQSDREYCLGEHQVTTKKCSMEIVAKSTNELEQNSVCSGQHNFVVDLVEDYDIYLRDRVWDKVKPLLGKRNSYMVLGVGLHYQLITNHVIYRYLDKIVRATQTKGNDWPRIIWIGIHAVYGFLRMATGPSNLRIYNFNQEIYKYLRQYNISILDSYPISKNLRSYDGRHYGVGFNMLKIQVLMNFLSEINRSC